MKQRYSHVYQAIATVLLIAFVSISASPTFAAKDDGPSDAASCCYGVICLTLCMVGMYGMSADIRYMPSAQFLGKSPDYIDQYIEIYQGLELEERPRPSFLRRAFHALRAIPSLLLSRVLGA